MAIKKSWLDWQPPAKHLNGPQKQEVRPAQEAPQLPQNSYDANYSGMSWDEWYTDMTDRIFDEHRARRGLLPLKRNHVRRRI